MRDVGLTATELGPEGFLPTAPAAMAKVLADHHLTAAGGFTPVLMHRPEHDPQPDVGQILDGYAASNAGVLVLSAVSGLVGYDTRPELDADGWRVLLTKPGPALAAGRAVRRSGCPAPTRRNHDRNRRGRSASTR
jgi:inosose dehydratase